MYIVLEGYDRVGKTTVIQRLKEELGNEVLFINEPSSDIAKEYISLLPDDQSKLIGFMIDRYNQLERIRQHPITISDRSYLSSLVYQDVNSSNAQIYSLNKYVIGNYKTLKPNFFLLLDDAQRISKRIYQETGDIQPANLIRRRQNQYIELVKQYPEHEIFNAPNYRNFETFIDVVVNQILVKVNSCF